MRGQTKDGALYSVWPEDGEAWAFRAGSMRLLLTGSGGWLGRHIYPLLIASGHEVIGLDITHGPCVDVVGRIDDRAWIQALFSIHGFDGVIHTAALHKPDIQYEDEQRFVDINITATLNLLQSCVRAACKRFIYTSTTSLMVSREIRAGSADHAYWLDEDFHPIEPRNIYGVTKLAAEGLCRQFAEERDLSMTVLRTSRFFPEDDDTLTGIEGANLKSNELLHRRVSVRDAARAHLAALNAPCRLGMRSFIVSAPTPFSQGDVVELKRNAQAVIERYFPKALEVYDERGWRLPQSIDRVYDGRRIARELGFRYEVDFAAALEALRTSGRVLIEHDPAFQPPHRRFQTGAKTLSVSLTG